MLLTNLVNFPNGEPFLVLPETASLIVFQDIIIAIDGYSGVGKSSTAKAVAQQLDYTYIDSGAMYRAATLYFIRHGVAIQSSSAVREALDHIRVLFVRHADQKRYETYLNGENVEKEIRSMEVSGQVSPVSAIPAVRYAMVAQQRAMGSNKRVVMDGRDIGTNVFPQAELKVFMKADSEVRARRRQAELRAQGQEVTVSEIARNLTQRDQLDSSREENPLVMAEDAVVLDTTHLNFEEQVQGVVALAQKIIHS